MSEVKDGDTIKVVIDGGAMDGVTLEMDPFLVKLAAEELYEKHGMEADAQQRLHPTPGFAQDLAERIKSFTHDDMSPRIAIYLWTLASDWWSDLQKKTNKSPS